MNDPQLQEEGRRNRHDFLLKSLYQRKPMSVRVLGSKLAAFASSTSLPLALPKVREAGTWDSLVVKTANSLRDDHLADVTGEGKERQVTLSDDALNPRGEAMSAAEAAARQPALDLVGDGAPHSRAEVRSMLMNSAALSQLGEIEQFLVADCVVDGLSQQPGMQVQNGYGQEVFTLSSSPGLTESTGASTVVADTNVAGEATAETQRAVPQVDTPEPTDTVAAASELLLPSAETSATQQLGDIDDTAKAEEGEASVGIDSVEQQDGGEEQTGSADAAARKEPPLVVAGVKVHPVALLFPRPAPEQYAVLKEDMVKNGQRVRIPTVDEEAIDGLTRLMICDETGIKPLLEEIPPPPSLTEYVLSLNMNRRHLTASQKATIAVAAERMLAEEAAARERAGKSADGDAGGRGRKNPTQKVGEGSKHAGEAAEQAAKLTGSNREYVRTAKQIEEEDPKLFKDVQEGKTTLQQARKAIKKKPTNKKLPSKASTTAGKGKEGSAQAFDDSVFKNLVKDLKAAINARGKAFGNGRFFDSCVKALERFSTLLKKWQTEGSGKKPRTAPK